MGIVPKKACLRHDNYVLFFMRYFVYELAIMRNVCKSEHTYYYCLMCVYARLGLTLTFLRSSILM